MMFSFFALWLRVGGELRLGHGFAGERAGGRNGADFHANTGAKRTA